MWDLQEDERAAVDAVKVVTLVVAITVGAIVAAFMLPLGMDLLYGEDTLTATQDVSETVQIAGSYDATLDAASDASGITVTVNNTDGGSATATDVAEGANQTVTVDGEDVTVANVENTASNATIEYAHSATLGMGSSTTAIYLLMGVAIVLAVLLAFIRMAMTTWD